MDYEPIPGMKVVCVDDSTIDFRRLLVRGAVYTITRAWVNKFPDNHYRGNFGAYQPVVDLAEVSNPSGYGFHRNRFRLLDERRLDVFRQHLSPAPKNGVLA